MRPIEYFDTSIQQTKLEFPPNPPEFKPLISSTPTIHDITQFAGGAVHLNLILREHLYTIEPDYPTKYKNIYINNANVRTWFTTPPSIRYSVSADNYPDCDKIYMLGPREITLQDLIPRINAYIRNYKLNNLISNDESLDKF